MKCFNCCSDFTPTLSEPICKQCGFCYYCRDFTCPHHNNSFKNTECKEQYDNDSVLYSKIVNMVQGTTKIIKENH